MCVWETLFQHVHLHIFFYIAGWMLVFRSSKLILFYNHVSRPLANMIVHVNTGPFSMAIAAFGIHRKQNWYLLSSFSCNSHISFWLFVSYFWVTLQSIGLRAELTWPTTIFKHLICVCVWEDFSSQGMNITTLRRKLIAYLA